MNMIATVGAIVGAVMSSALTYLLTRHMAAEDRRSRDASEHSEALEIVIRELVRSIRSVPGAGVMQLPPGW